jgi:hypothetical protein
MVLFGIMGTQINIRLSEKLLETASTYALRNGYTNVQEFIKETIRKRLFEEDTLTEEELSLVTSLAKVTKEKKLVGSERELVDKLKK